MRKIPGIYVSIRGDFAQLKKDIAGAKQVVTEQARGISNALNNSLTPDKVKSGINALVADLGLLSRASKVSSADFAQLGIDLGKFQGVAGVADAQFAKLQSRMLETQTAKAQEKSLLGVAKAANLTAAEVRALGAQMGVPTAGIERSVAAVERELAALNGTTKTAHTSFGDLTTGILKSAPAFAVATAAITAAYGAVNLFTSGLKQGLGSVEEYNMNVIKMAALMTNYSQKAKDGDVAGAWKEAYSYSRKLVEDLEIIDARSAASGKNIIDMVSTLTTGGVIIDTNIKKQQDAVVGLANAIKILTEGQQNQDMQFVQEINAFLEGAAKPGSKLVGVLEKAGLNTKEFVQELNAGKKTIADILPYLAGFEAATGDIEETWTAVGSTLETIKTRVLRGGLEPVFNDLLSIAEDLRDTFMDSNGQLTEQGVILQESIASTWKDIKETLVPIIEMTGDLYDLYKSIKGIIPDIKIPYLFNTELGPGLVGGAADLISSGIDAVASKKLDIMRQLFGDKDPMVLRAETEEVDESLKDFFGTLDRANKKAGVDAVKAAAVATEAEKKAAEDAAKAAKQLAEQWSKTKKALADDLAVLGLSELDKELAEIAFRARDLREEFGQRSEIDAWAQSMSNAAITAASLKEDLALQDNVSRLRDEEFAADADALDEMISSIEDFRDVIDGVALESMPEYARSAEEVRRKYAEWQRELESLAGTGAISMEQAQEWTDTLNAGLDAELGEIAEKNKETATAISDTWKHAFEQIQDALADMLYKFEFSWQSIIDLARRGAAEYAAALIMQPFTGAQAGGAGGGSLSFGNLFSSSGWGGMQANLSAFALDGLGMEGASQWIMGQDASMLGSSLAGLGSFAMSLINGQSFGQSTTTGLGAFLGGLTPLGPIGSMLGGLAGNWLGDALGLGDNLQRGYLGTGYRYDYVPGAGFMQTDSAEWREDRNGEDFREASAALSDSLLTTLNTISGSFESLFGSLGRGSQYSDYLDQFGASAGGSRSYVNGPAIDPMYGPGGLSARAGSTLDLNAYISGEDEDEIARSVENIWLAATSGIIGPLVEGSADMLAEAMEGSFAALDLSMFSATAAEKLQGGLTDAIDLMRIGEITDTESLERELSELESGLGQARYVIDYVTEVVGLLGQIDDSIVSGNLTDAGRELKSINAKYDEMAGTLERLGVVVSETNLELARSEEIGRLQGSVTGSWQDIIDQNTMGEYDLARQNLEKWRDEETKKAMELGLATGLLTRAYDVQLAKIEELEAAALAQEELAGLNEELGVLSESLGGLESDLSAVRDTIESIDAKRIDLTYSGFNLAYPQARAQSAAADYETMFAAAGASPEGAADYLNFVNTYLTESQNAYKSSQQYLDIFAGVMDDLDSLGLTYQTQDTLLVGSIDSLTRQIAALEERIAGLEANVTVIVVDESGNEVSRTTETRRIIQNDDARIVRAAA